MTHPLENIIRDAEGFVLIGDSSKDRFPAMSFHSYTKTAKRFFCLDLEVVEIGVARFTIWMRWPGPVARTPYS